MDLRQQLGVETPEHVEVHLELAGVGSRTAAAFFDTVLLNLGVILIVVVARTIGTRLSGAVEGWLMAALVLLYYFAVLGYFVLFEALNGGRRLGKQALGIRVVMATGHPVTPTAAVVRNVVRLVDCYFPLLPVLPGLLFVFLQRRNQRPGDLAAGTVVVRDRPTDWSLGAANETPVEEVVETGPPDLSDEEFRLLDQFMARRDQLEPTVEVRMAAELARRFEARVPRRTTDTEAYLATLLAEEQRKRRSRFATRGRRRTPVLRYLLRDFPAAVVLSWRQVVAAALLFVVPAAVGYVMIRERPQLAEEVMSPVMVGRAEQAAERQARGIGYAQSPEEELPVIASAIIGTNVLVAFGTFVGGLVAGTLTVWALVMNGLQLGMGFGLFVNHRAGAYLATFIAGHGLLELTAIFIAAGAGFRIAGALIAPGDRTRRDALVVEGRIAAQMLGAVVSLLVVAGTIEGLLSASDAPAALKYAVSATSAVLLVLYLRNGWAASIAATAPAS